MTPAVGQREPAPSLLTGWRSPGPGRRRRSHPWNVPESSTMWPPPGRRRPRPHRPANSAAPGKRLFCYWSGLDFPQIALKEDMGIPSQLLKGWSQSPSDPCSRSLSLGIRGTWWSHRDAGARLPGFKSLLHLSYLCDLYHVAGLSVPASPCLKTDATPSAWGHRTKRANTRRVLEVVPGTQ